MSIHYLPRRKRKNLILSYSANQKYKLVFFRISSYSYRILILDYRANWIVLPHVLLIDCVMIDEFLKLVNKKKLISSKLICSYNKRLVE